MWANLLAKIASLLTIPVLNWLYEKVSHLLSRWLRDKELKKEHEGELEVIKKEALETAEQTKAATTKEDLKRAAENTARNY